MKIQIENNKDGIGVTVETNDDNISKQQLAKICSDAYDIIDSLKSKPAVQSEISNPMKIELVSAQPKQEMPKNLIRQRIPNNIVDIKDLSIEKAVTEEALVRCPHCGQAHCLAISSGDNKVYVMARNFDKNEFNTIAEFDSLTSEGLAKMCCKEDTDRQAYFNDLQSIRIIDYSDFMANNETEVFCPVCCKSDSFLEWKNAFENPLQYFETEHLCDACGGEKIEKLIKKRKVYQCESCGLVTDFKEE